MALPEDNDPMILTEFDGFCAGLVTCPKLIPDLVEKLNHFAKSRAPSLLLGFPLTANMTSEPVVGPKAGRNDPCPCGSGKKFKKCCGAGLLPLH